MTNDQLQQAYTQWVQQTGQTPRTNALGHIREDDPFFQALKQQGALPDDMSTVHIGDGGKANWSELEGLGASLLKGGLIIGGGLAGGAGIAAAAGGAGAGAGAGAAGSSLAAGGSTAGVAGTLGTVGTIAKMVRPFLGDSTAGKVADGVSMAGGGGSMPGTTPPIVSNTDGPWWQKIIQAGQNIYKGNTAGDVAGTVGDTAAAIEKGRQSGADRALKNSQAAQTYGSTAYKNALVSALAKNIQDYSVERPNGVPTVHATGGLRPSAIGPEGRAAATEMNGQAMRQLMSAKPYNALPDDLNGNGVDTVLGTFGTVGKAIQGLSTAGKQNGIADLIAEYLKKARPPTAAPQTPPFVGPIDPNADDPTQGYTYGIEE